MLYLNLKLVSMGRHLISYELLRRDQRYGIFQKYLRWRKFVLNSLLFPNFPFSQLKSKLFQICFKRIERIGFPVNFVSFFGVKQSQLAAPIILYGHFGGLYK